MAGDDQARQVVRRLQALGGGPEVVRKAAARLLGQLPANEAAELLGQLMRLAREGWDPASGVLPAFIRALDLEIDQIPSASALPAAAARQHLDEVARLFSDAPARLEYELEAAKRADSRLFSQPLGRLTQIARLTRNPDELATLAVATDPSVIRNVLLNSRLTEALVVAIAARRPARPEPLVEIWRSARWSTRPLVRKALAFNPYFPPDVGAKIVPLLSRADLCELADDRAVHPAIRQQAQGLTSPLETP